MTKTEFAKFAMAMRSCYPKENLLPSDEAMDIWFQMLADIPYQVASAGLQQWVQINRWSPSIADIRAMILEVKHGEIADWSQGWEEVQKAIRNFGMYRPDEALESMSAVTKRVVSRLGFKNLCLSENQEADRANFRQIYQAEAERDRKNAVLSADIKNRIGMIQTKLIEGGET